MQFNTILKVGGLAFDVAQDEKVRELATMVHKGAKRRGLIGSVQQQTGGSSASDGNKQSSAKTSEDSHPVPFTPAKKSPSDSKKAPQPSFDVSKMLNGKNAKKVLSYAGELTQLLMK